MAFPVDVLTAVEPESLEVTAKDYIAQLHRNLTAPEHLSLSDSQKIKIELCNMSFVPLYGTNSSSKVLALFSCDNLYQAVGLYLLGQWWSIEDVLKTSDPSRTGLISVSTIGERVVLYVLNRIIYREKEKGGEDIMFLCHCEHETAKILWKDGKAIGFYSVKLKGSLCSSFLTLPFELHVMDTIFVRQSHRGSGHGLQMLEDFIQGFKKESLGLKCPVSPSMYKVCEKYFSVHPADRERLWEVKGTGSPFQRTLVAKRFPKLQVKDQVVSKLNFEDDHFITPMETEIEKMEIVEKTTRNVVKELDSTPVKRCARCCKPLGKEKQISGENRTRVENTAVFGSSTVGLTGETLLKSAAVNTTQLTTNTTHLGVLQKEKKQDLGNIKVSLGEVSVSHFGATGEIKEQELCYTKTQSATILSVDQRQVGEEKMVQRNTESDEQNNTMIGLEEEALIIENMELQQMSDEFKRQKAESDTYMDTNSQMPHEVGVEKEIDTNKVSITNQAENRSDLEKKKGHCEEEIQEKSQTRSVDKMTSEGFVEKTLTTENDSHGKEQKSLIETESTVLKRSTQTVSQLVYKETDQTAPFSPSQVSEQRESFVEDNASESMERTKEESQNIQKQHKGKVKQKTKNVFTAVEETVSTHSTSLRRSTRVKGGTRQEESSGPDDALNSRPEQTTMRPTTEDSSRGTENNTQDVDHETFEMLRDVEEVHAEANQDSEEKADDKRETFQISETCGGEMDQDIAEHETVHIIQDSEKGGLNEETEPDGYEVNANDSSKDLNQDSDKTKGGEAVLGAFTFSEVSDKPNTLASNEMAKGEAQSEEELQEDVHEEERMEAENTIQKQDVQEHKVGTSGVMESQVEVYRETEAIVEENVSTVEEEIPGGLKCTHECAHQETDEGQGHHVLQIENEQQTTRETIIIEGHKSAVNGKPVEHVSWIEISEANNEANSHSSDLTVSSFRSKVQPTPLSTSSQRKAGIHQTERSEMEVNFNSDETVVEQHNVSDEIIENILTVDEDSECAKVSRDSEIITGTSQDSIEKYVEDQMRVEAKNDTKLENTGTETSIDDMEMVDIFEEEASTSTERCLRKRTIHIQHLSSPPRKKSKHLHKIQPNVVELEKRSENKIADDDDDDNHHQIIEKQHEETDQEILEIQHPELPMDERPILEDICLDLENEDTDSIIVLQKDTEFLIELNKPIEETEENIEIAEDQAHSQNQEDWEKPEKQDPIKLPSKHENPHIQVTELDYEAKTPHEGHTVEEHDKQSRTTEKLNYAKEFVEENGGIIVNQISTSGEPEKPTQKGTIESHEEHSVIQTEGGTEIISCVKEKTICETFQEDVPVITERNLRQRTINVPLKQTTPTKKSKLVQKQETELCQNIAIPKTTVEEDIVESFEGEAYLLEKTTESDVPSTRLLLETGPLVENVEEKQMESETVLTLKPSQCVSGKSAQSTEIFSHIEDTETDFEKTTRRSLRLSSRPVVFTPKAQSKHARAEKMKTTKEGRTVTDECENICADVETVHVCVSSMTAEDSLKIIQHSGDMVSSEHDTHTSGSVSDAHSKEPPGDENITESSVHKADGALVRVDQSEADEQNYNDNVTGKDGRVMQLQEYRCDMVTLDSSQSLKILAEAVMEKRVLRKRIISTGSPHKSKRICKQEHAEEHKKKVSEEVKFTSGVSAVEDITQQIQKDLERTASDATTQEEDTTDRPEDHKDEQTEVDDDIEVTRSNRDEIIDVEEKHEETEEEQVESSRNKFFTLELEEEEKSDQPEDTDQNKMDVDVPKEIVTCLEKSVEVEENISEVDDDGDEDDEEQDLTAQRISDQQSVIVILKKHPLEVNEDEAEEHEEVEDKHDVSESPRKGRKAVFSDDSTPLRRSKRLEIKKFA